MKRYMMVGAALAAASLGPLPVMAQKTAVPAPSLLTVLEANAKPGNAVYEAGSRGPQTAAGPLEHIFVLRNTTGTALTLDHLQASCACTTATVVGGTSADGPTVLAPNGTLSVRVSVDLQRLLPGLLHKSVWVFVQGQAAPAATLEMTGALLPLVSFAPPSLSFGRIEKGTELTLLLRATTPPERLEQGTELRLVSLEPGHAGLGSGPGCAEATGRAFLSGAPCSLPSCRTAGRPLVAGAGGAGRHGRNAGTGRGDGGVAGRGKKERCRRLPP